MKSQINAWIIVSENKEFALINDTWVSFTELSNDSSLVATLYFDRDEANKEIEWMNSYKDGFGTPAEIAKKMVEKNPVIQEVTVIVEF